MGRSRPTRHSRGGWAERIPDLDGAGLAHLIERVAVLVAQRPAVLAHSDFAPVNVLTEGTSLTSLLDFEAVRLADPLFDPAWWAWSVSFSSALEAAWPAFHDGAEIDAPEFQRIVADRLRTTLG